MNIGDYVAHGAQRASRSGTWQGLSGPDSQLRGGLRLDTIQLDQGIADRLSETVRAVRVLGLSGINTLVDQVHDGSFLWLVSEVPAAPTLNALFDARPQLPPAIALLIAVDVAETLSALHSNGLAHGDINGDTVILTDDGRAILVETGYAHALAGTTPGPGHDANGWVALARALATAASKNAVLLAAANQAEGIGGSAGLTAALGALSTAVAVLPGYGERSALGLLASMVPQLTANAAPLPAPTAAATPENVTVKLPPPDARYQAYHASPAVAAPPVAPVPVPHNNYQQPPPVGPSGLPPTARLMPGTPPPGVARVGEMDTMPVGAASPVDSEATISPEELATRMGKRSEEVLRFGRGVGTPVPPPQNPAGPGWQTVTPPPRRRSPWRKRIIGLLSGALTVVILAVVGWFVIQRVLPLKIESIGVVVATPLGANNCDVKVDVVGTVTSNGAGGSFTYRWVRVDGVNVTNTSVLTEAVAFGSDVTQVHLLWSFSGKGSVNAKATLEIISPKKIAAAIDFVYNCK